MNRLFSYFCLMVLGLAVVRAEKPNFVIIFTDDQGYQDLGCFGSPNIKTPHIDRMAKEGRKFTNFLVASPVCTPSRAALLTGCYPKRVGMHQHVLFPASTKGLNASEHTIADYLKGEGYATAAVGKWHLGHHPEVLPMANGFDSYYGIPYSNDMNHPDNKGKPKDSSDALWRDQESTITKWKTPLMENEKIIELPVDQRTITRRCTDRAIAFVEANKEKPFFLYLAHSMPHIPLYVPEDVYDPDPKNAYKCTIEHIDAEVGRLMETLRTHGLDKNTYVVYTSDNGPWLRFGTHGGSALPLREGKGTTFEGGQRVPCVMWGPGRIPAGTTCAEVAGTIDLLPTIAGLAGFMLKEDRKIDGMDVRALLTGDAESPRKEFLYYTSRGDIEGIRQGKWKLLLKKAQRKRGNQKKEEEPAATAMLFDLDADVSEAKDLAEGNPEVVEKLTKRMMELDGEIGAEARAPWVKGE